MIDQYSDDRTGWARFSDDIRDRITRLTLAAGLPPDVWSELCKIDSDLRAAIRAQTASAPHVNAELATIGPLMTQAEVEQLRVERDDPGDDADRVREIVSSVASVDVSAAVAIDIANRVAAILVPPPPTSADRVLAARPRGRSLDRFPDNDGNYEPGNCRWATRKQQAHHSRYSPLASPLAPDTIALLGVLPDPALAAQLGVSAHRIKAERRARGIPPVTAGRKPRGEVAADVSRTVKLTPAEAAAQDAAAGDLPWATWAHDTLVARAAGSEDTT